jgi:hypothetical protein
MTRKVRKSGFSCYLYGGPAEVLQVPRIGNIAVTHVTHETEDMFLVHFQPYKDASVAVFDVVGNPVNLAINQPLPDEKIIEHEFTLYPNAPSLTIRNEVAQVEIKLAIAKGSCFVSAISFMKRIEDAQVTNLPTPFYPAAGTFHEVP